MDWLHADTDAHADRIAGDADGYGRVAYLASEDADTDAWAMSDMFTTTTLPPIFQHTAVSSTMALHVPAAGYGRPVALVRTLRDGAITREYMPQHLAELVIAMIPFGEPLVASARIAYSEL